MPKTKQKWGKLTAHTGLDYSVVMFDDETTDDASIQVRGPRAKEIAERIAAIWNAKR